MTLAELAGGQLSVALVSKIERGLVTPSVASLRYLADRLGLSPAALWDEGDERHDLLGALLRARIRLLLGDPAGAAELAQHALGQLAAPADGQSNASTDPPDQANLLGAELIVLVAQAHVQAGNTSAAGPLLAEASRRLGGVSSDTPRTGGRRFRHHHDMGLMQAELVWLLGAVEARRGARLAAERNWGRALDLLEVPRQGPLRTALLQAHVLADLGALYENAGAVETARNFLTRAVVALAQLSEPATAARRLLTSAEATYGDQQSQTMQSVNGVSVVLLMAEGLAIVHSAARLCERVAQSLGHLDRPAALAAVPPPPDLPYGRHLR